MSGDPPEEALEFALERYAEFLSGLPNVVGMGIREEAGTGRLVLAVSVSRKVSESLLRPDQRIPAHLGVEWAGVDYRVPVRVFEEGEIRPE